MAVLDLQIQGNLNVKTGVKSLLWRVSQKIKLDYKP